MAETTVRSRQVGKTIRLKAASLLHSCLEAARVPHEVVEPDRFVVATRGGGEVVVSITFGRTVASEGKLEVSAEDVVSPEPGVAREAFHAVTEAAGYGTPAVIDRGPGVGHVYGDNHDLVVFRHRQFRLAPNAPAAVFEADYKSVVEAATRKFYRQNVPACDALGFEVDDLRTYAQVWTNVFWALGRRADLDVEQNRRLLYKYLRQRFSELHTQLRGHRSRNTLVDRQAAALGQGVQYSRGRRLDDRSAGAAEWSATREDDPESILIRAEEAQSGGEARRARGATKSERAAAASELAEALAALPHDSMVLRLEQVRDSAHVSPDARSEAKRVLEQHEAGCPEPSCLAAAAARASSSKNSRDRRASLEKSVWVSLDVD